MIGLYAAALAICVGLAFLLPGNFFTSRWFDLLPILALLGLPPMVRRAERSRIRAAVEGEGGRIVRLKRLPFWKQELWRRLSFGYQWGWPGPKYEVEFVDLLGRNHHGLCRSSFYRGITWLNLV